MGKPDRMSKFFLTPRQELGLENQIGWVVLQSHVPGRLLLNNVKILSRKIEEGKYEQKKKENNNFLDKIKY